MPDPSPDLVERVNRARRFPENTCGASRHAQGVAEAMMQGDVLPEVTDDPTHIGESILSTVAALYEARSEITRLRAEVEALRKAALMAKRIVDDECEALGLGRTTNSFGWDAKIALDAALKEPTA